jgi:hypothetical protein
MSLTNKLTAIGDAVRSKTGGTSALTLPQMAAAIREIPTGSENTRCWKLTVQSDTSAASIVSIAESDWLKSARSNSGLVISLVPTGTVTAATVRVTSAIQSNHPVSGGNYGYAIRYNVAGNSVTLAMLNQAINTSATYPQGFKIDSDGALTYSCRDGGTSHSLAAGEYLVTVTVNQ